MTKCLLPGTKVTLKSGEVVFITLPVDYHAEVKPKRRYRYWAVRELDARPGPGPLILFDGEEIDDPQAADEHTA